MVALNGRVTMKDKCRGLWREADVAYFKAYSITYLRGLEKAIKDHSQIFCTCLLVYYIYTS